MHCPGSRPRASSSVLLMAAMDSPAMAVASASVKSAQASTFKGGVGLAEGPQAAKAATISSGVRERRKDVINGIPPGSGRDCISGAFLRLHGGAWSESVLPGRLDRPLAVFADDAVGHDRRVAVAAGSGAADPGLVFRDPLDLGEPKVEAFPWLDIALCAGQDRRLIALETAEECRVR